MGKANIRFTCLRCGLCCMTSPISLLPHEILVLNNLAASLNVKLKFVEGYAVYDRISGVNVTLTYHMQLGNSGKCVFLGKNNLCLIHNRYKPLICRSFPYTIKSINYYFDPVAKIAFHRSNYTISSACEFIKKHKNTLEPYLKDELLIKKFFNDETRYASLMEKYRSMYLLALSYLWRVGYIDLVSDARIDRPYVNAYLFIRRYIPYFAIRPY